MKWLWKTIYFRCSVKLFSVVNFEWMIQSFSISVILIAKENVTPTCFLSRLWNLNVVSLFLLFWAFDKFSPSSSSALSSFNSYNPISLFLSFWQVLMKFSFLTFCFPINFSYFFSPTDKNLSIILNTFVEREACWDLSTFELL